MALSFKPLSTLGIFLIPFVLLVGVSLSLTYIFPSIFPSPAPLLPSSSETKIVSLSFCCYFIWRNSMKIMRHAAYSFHSFSFGKWTNFEPEIFFYYLFHNERTASVSENIGLVIQKKFTMSLWPFIVNGSVYIRLDHGQ